MVMMVWAQGEQYSGPELSRMLTEAGFSDIQIEPTPGYTSIITGRKP